MRATSVWVLKNRCDTYLALHSSFIVMWPEQNVLQACLVNCQPTSVLAKFSCQFIWISKL